jgi:CheY-like chemotaxis protein
MDDSDRTILIVDDDDDQRTMVAEVLRRAGYVVTNAASGPEACQLALQVLPHLVIMDIGMPEMDGLTTVWKMRKHEELSTVPVIILTAYDSYDLRDEAASAGCCEYLTKPFGPEELQELVNRRLTPSPSAPTGKY